MKTEVGLKEGIVMKNIMESELKILEVLWNQGDMAPKGLIIKLEESEAWSDRTTLQVIRNCVAKGLIERLETNYMYRAAITKEEAKKQGSDILTEKISSDLLSASLLGGSNMNTFQIDKLHHMVQVFIAEELAKKINNSSSKTY